MSDYNRETAFLRQMLIHDESSESRQVDGKIARVERERACLQKAAWVVALLTGLALMLSQVEFFQSDPKIRLRIILVIALAALICLLTFLATLAIYRWKLNSLRDECRGLVAKFVAGRIIRQDVQSISGGR